MCVLQFFESANDNTAVFFRMVYNGKVVSGGIPGCQGNKLCEVRRSFFATSVAGVCPCFRYWLGRSLALSYGLGWRSCCWLSQIEEWPHGTQNEESHGRHALMMQIILRHNEELLVQQIDDHAFWLFAFTWTHSPTACISHHSCNSSYTTTRCHIRNQFLFLCALHGQTRMHTTTSEICCMIQHYHRR